MQNHSFIGVEMPNGTIEAIYCSKFGQPEALGHMLHTHYNSLLVASQILGLGDLSYLEKKLSPEQGQSHDFENPAVGITVAYKRDKGETGTEAKVFENMNEFLFYCDLFRPINIFLFRNGSWFYSENPSKDDWNHCFSIDM